MSLFPKCQILFSLCDTLLSDVRCTFPLKSRLDDDTGILTGDVQRTDVYIYANCFQRDYVCNESMTVAGTGDGVSIL